MHSVFDIVILICLIRGVWAELYNCKYIKIPNKICVIGEGNYNMSHPKKLDTTFYLHEIVSIDENENSVSIQATFISFWKDSELKLSNNSDRFEFWIEKEEAKSIWKPLIFFDNLMELETSKTYGESIEGALGYDHGTLQYAKGFKMTFSCHFDFAEFPFDSHDCGIHYFSGETQMIMTAAKIGYGSESTINGSSIVLKNLPFTFDVILDSRGRKELNFPMISSNLSATGLSIRLERKAPYFLLTSFYFPTTAFALLSMISFLIKPDIVPGRMGTILTLFLIHTNVYNSHHGRGFSFIEVWVIGTQIPILFALIEYGVVLYWQRVAKKTNQVQRNNGNDPQSNLDEKIKNLDLISMISSFLFFIIYVLFYTVLIS